MNDLEIITTADGSHSLFNKVLNETYHSQHGAVQESKHVFIKHGLQFFSEKHSNSPVRILEIGFGTGLNAWLTFDYARQHNKAIHYTSLETYPLPEEIWRSLNYVSESEKETFHQLHKAHWNADEMISSFFTIHKNEISLQNFHSSIKFDIVYFDAFAPNKQPEMWTKDVLQKVCDQLNDQGVFVTYCAKGQLKRDLREVGLVVETLPGPPGKKEMVRAIKA